MSKIQPNSKLLTKHNYVLHYTKIILKDTIMHTNGFYLIEYARHEHKIVVLNGIIKRITDDVLQTQKLKKLIEKRSSVVKTENLDQRLQMRREQLQELIAARRKHYSARYEAMESATNAAMFDIDLAEEMAYKALEYERTHLR